MGLSSFLCFKVLLSKVLSIWNREPECQPAIREISHTVGLDPDFQQESDTKPFPFLQLPVEIRVIIYELVFVGPERIRLQDWHRDCRANILRVCRVTRSEAMAIYARKHGFYLNVRYHQAELSEISPSFLVYLRDLKLCMAFFSDMFHAGPGISRRQATWPAMIRNCPNLHTVHLDFSYQRDLNDKEYSIILIHSFLQLGHRKNRDINADRESPKITALVDIHDSGGPEERRRCRYMIRLNDKLCTPFHSMEFGKLRDIRLYGLMSIDELAVVRNMAKLKMWMDEEDECKLRLHKKTRWEHTGGRVGQAELEWMRERD